MSEFKYACPVCGQHIKCDSSQSGTVMECPTCFQKITAPQAPAAEDAKFILSGTKVRKRSMSPMAPTALETGAPAPPSERRPFLVVIVLVVLVCVGAAALVVFHGRNSHPTPKVTPPAPVERKHGAIGLAAWNTQVEYTNVVVTKGSQTLYQSDFVPSAPGWQIGRGVWIATNGVFRQTLIAEDCRAVTGDPAWSDYTLTLRARKLGGREGFLVMFNVVDDQNWTWWSIGGWNNACYAIENGVSGVKSLLTDKVPGQIDAGRWYDIRIELNGPHIRCYLNGVMIHDITYPTPTSSPASSPHS